MTRVGGRSCSAGKDSPRIAESAERIASLPISKTILADRRVLFAVSDATKGTRRAVNGYDGDMTFLANLCVALDFAQGGNNAGDR